MSGVCTRLKATHVHHLGPAACAPWRSVPCSASGPSSLQTRPPRGCACSSASEGTGAHGGAFAPAPHALWQHLHTVPRLDSQSCNIVAGSAVQGAAKGGFIIWIHYLVGAMVFMWRWPQFLDFVILCHQASTGVQYSGGVTFHAHLVSFRQIVI
jgi:hypothetical protein